MGAELTVLLGDLRMLEQTDISQQHAVGLRQRIEGGLVALDILGRLADQESGRPPVPQLELIGNLRAGLNNNRLAEIVRTLSELLVNYPLVFPDIVINDSSEFADLHQSLCAACHDQPNAAVARPAYNLSKQSSELTEIEMFARMLVGVRGDRITGIDNPLTDRQIVGLLHYYNNSP